MLIATKVFLKILKTFYINGMDSTNKPKLFPVEISKDLDKEDLTA